MGTLSSQVRAKSADGLSLLLALLIKANTGNHFASSLTASYYLSFPKDNPGNKIKGWVINDNFSHISVGLTVALATDFIQSMIYILEQTWTFSFIQGPLYFPKKSTQKNLHCPVRVSTVPNTGLLSSQCLMSILLYLSVSPARSQAFWGSEV